MAHAARAPAAGNTGPLVPGENFGRRYHIVRLLGLGGMGAVYQAWDEELGVVAAVKVTRPEIAADPEAASLIERRFKQELLLARQVTHKNVVRIHDIGEVNGIKYITMPFIEGEDLATIIEREGKLPVPRVMKIARSLTSGLAAAHAVGVVHRDLKPANLMIDTDGEALITDFGIARSTGGPPAALPQSAPLASRSFAPAAHTVMGAVVGTIGYMAPEQAQAKPVDQRADIYAVGLILYDMLGGRRRFAAAESPIAELTSRTLAAPPSTRTFSPEVPEAIDRIVLKCLQPDPSARYQTTQELRADLDRLDDNGKPLPMVRRLTWRLMTGAAALLVLATGVTYYVARGRAPQAEHPPMSVLVADFDNQTGDPVFTGAVEETLGLALEGARFVSLYPRTDAQALVNQLKPGAHLDEGMARALSRREKIDVILAGSIARDGSGYRISMRAIDPARDDGKPIATATTTASGKGGVLEALNVAAARIRGPLGDTTPEAARLASAETFTTTSPEAVKSFDVAQGLLFAGRTEEALAAFTRATQEDPGFARAWSSAAVAAGQLGREKEAQDLWKKALALIDRVSERERYRILGTYAYTVAHDPQKAIDNFKTLVEKYPGDRVGVSGLALAYFWSLRMSEALAAGRRALDLNPNDVIVRANYGDYAMYAGDFKTAVEQMERVLQQNPKIGLAHLPMAMAALVRGDSAGALAAYDRMAATGASGASMAAMGRADVALFEGRYGDAKKLLEAGIAADDSSRNVSAMAAKYVALAESEEGLGETSAAIAAARKAIELSADGKLQSLAALVLIRNGQERLARPIVTRLSGQLTREQRAYGKLLDAQIAVKERRMGDAVDAFTAAQQLADLWLVRFHLGVAYLEAGHFPEALSELERSEKRKGEATAVLLDDTPSFRYYATLPYWKARAQQALGQHAAAAAGFEAFIASRAAATRDPIVADARKRLSR